MYLLAQTSPIDQLTNLGVAGIMGAMWLWERRTSQQREQQLDDAHARILADKIQLDQLMDTVRTNTQARTQLASTQEQLLDRIAEYGVKK